jgi:hypothetical protein
MEVNSIFLYGKSGRLSKTAAMEVCLQNLKENFSPTVFRIDLQPGPAFSALRKIFAIRGNLGSRHLFTIRQSAFMSGA